MTISSAAFENNTTIPAKYTCDGENINPPLTFSNIPKEAKSLVLIVEDPDAPAKTWLHWTLWNINPATTQIPPDTTPEGAVAGETDFGTTGYGGPCPPSGKHRYIFKLFALDAMLTLNTGASLNELEKEIKNRVLAETVLVGLYQRQ